MSYSAFPDIIRVHLWRSSACPRSFPMTFSLSAALETKMKSFTLERSYAPTASSPLNPTRYGESPARTPRQDRGISRIQKATAMLSPTQRLLRQKVEAAWNPETLRRKESDQDRGAGAPRAGIDLTRDRGRLRRGEEHGSSMDLENRAGLATRGSILDEKNVEYADCLVNLAGTSEYLNTRSGGRHLAPSTWRVLLLVGLASIFSLLIPLLQRQFTFKLPPMVS